MKKLNNTLTLFLYLQPFIDVLTYLEFTYTQFTISLGLVLRGFMLFYLGYLLLLHNRSSITRKDVWYLSGLTSFFLVYLGFRYLALKNLHAVVLEALSLAKVFYLVTLLLIINIIHKKNNVKIALQHFHNVFLIYVGFLIIPYLIGMAASSYSANRLGSSGFFISPNEVGAIISIMFPLYCLSLKQQHKLVAYLGLLASIASMLILGTKLVLISMILTIILIIIKYHQTLLYKNKTSQRIRLYLTALAIFIGSVALLPQTPIYKNYLIYKEYLEVDNIFEIVTDIDHIDHIVFSMRLQLLNNEISTYQKATLQEKLIGLGYYRMDENTIQEVKLIEMDFLDIFFKIGLIGFILYLLPFIKNLKEFKYNNSYLNLSLFMALFSALMVGHTFTAPALALLLVLLLNNSINLTHDKDATTNL